MNPVKPIWRVLKSKTVRVLALLFLVTILAHHVYLYVSINRVRDEIRALGYPTSVPELAAWKPLPEGTVNAADVYRQAFERLAAESDDTEILPVVGNGP